MNHQKNDSKQPPKKKTKGTRPILKLLFKKIIHVIFSFVFLFHIAFTLILIGPYKNKTNGIIHFFFLGGGEEEAKCTKLFE